MKTATSKKLRDPAQAREALVQSAIKLFNTKTYFNTDSNEIAKAAGYTPGTFYRYFKDKLEIFKEVYCVWHEQQRLAIMDLLEHNHIPEEFCRKLTTTILPFYVEWSGFRASVRCLSATDKQVLKFRLERREGLINLTNLVRRSFGKPIKPVVETLFMLLTLERISDAVADGDFKYLKISLGEVTQRLEKLFLDYLLE
ncbi:MAG: TetR/AcrR family transcriptional regulator [Acidobacteriota bacterium]